MSAARRKGSCGTPAAKPARRSRTKPSPRPRRRVWFSGAGRARGRAEMRELLGGIGVEQGGATRSDLKLGICGEHGGDPRSVQFCLRVGLDSVPCSPFRGPVARLAAARAALEEGVA